MKIRPFYLLILFLLLLIGIELFYTSLPTFYERTSQVMGTTVRVKINGPGSPHLTRRAIFEIQRLDRIFSKFNPSSEVSRLNCGEKFPLLPDTRKVLALAEKVKRLSRGAFDICYSGKIDLGAVGKGYAVESARRLLLKKGVRSAIIDMHSSIAVVGGPWKVGILDPRNQKPVIRNQRKILGTVVLNDGDALSTSAQYEQPGHIIDPRTGKRAEGCLSVTIVGKDAGFVDALSTAIFVLGAEEGMKLVKELDAKAVIVDMSGKIYDNFGFKLR